MAAGERGRNYLNGSKDLGTGNGTRQRRNLALTGLCLTSSLDNGARKRCTSTRTGQRCKPSWLMKADQITKKVDVRPPGKGSSNSHGARPIHLIITMIKWIRTSRLTIKNSLSWLIKFIKWNQIDHRGESLCHHGWSQSDSSTERRGNNLMG